MQLLHTCVLQRILHRSCEFTLRRLNCTLNDAVLFSLHVSERYVANLERVAVNVRQGRDLGLTAGGGPALLSC